MQDRILIFTEIFSNTLIREFDEVKALPKTELNDICKSRLDQAKEYKWVPDSKIDYNKAIEDISADFKTLHDKHYQNPLDLEECYDILFDQTLINLLSL